MMFLFATLVVLALSPIAAEVFRYYETMYRPIRL